MTWQERREIYNKIASQLKAEYKRGNLTKGQYQFALNKAFDDCENGTIARRPYSYYWGLATSQTGTPAKKEPEKKNPPTKKEPAKKAPPAKKEPTKKEPSKRDPVSPARMTPEEYEAAKKEMYRKYKNGEITNYAYIQWKKKNDPSLNGGGTGQTGGPSGGSDGGRGNPGDKATDAAVAAVERQLKEIYGEAARDLQRKLADFTAKQAAKQAEMKRKLDAGEITQEEYADWMNRNVFRTNLWRQKIDQATGVLLDANRQAAEIVNNRKMGVFAENANFQAYQITKDAGINLNFAIYDMDAVENLIKKQPELLPRKVVNGQKDQAWNQKQIANAVTQGIIQGESIPDLAKRIARDTTSANGSAMVRYARTAMTGAQNMGRMETLHRAQGMGIKCKKCWLATLDSRTRDSHQEMDGVTIDVDAKFKTPLGSTMDCPGDLAGKGGDVWNCRCTLTYVYEGYEGKNAERIAYNEYVDEDGNPHRESYLIKDMTYKQWKNQRSGVQIDNNGGGNTPIGNAGTTGGVNGTDMTGTWKRRPELFETEIADIINAQGFDNNPRVVGREEFDKAVEESGIIAQRAYRAKDQKTLDEYADELYHGGPGHWYVDASVGGDSYGQGMYSAVSTNGKITKEMKEAMEELYGKEKDGTVARVETFTMAKDAKIITLQELYEMEDVDKYRGQLEIYKSARTGEESIDNITSLATLLGYDAVIVDGEGEMIVLNRSKCIFLRQDENKEPESARIADEASDEIKKAAEKYVKETESYEGRLTARDKEVLADYSDGKMVKETNGWLRHNENDWKQSQEDDIEENIENLDKAIEKEKLRRNTTLYRGVPADYLGLDFSDPDKLIGQTVEDRGYMSTTGAISVARKYGQEIVLEIDTPKGTHVAYSDLAKRSWAELSGGGINAEYLVERGCELKFTGYTREIGADGKEYLKMQCKLVPRYEKREKQIKAVLKSATTAPMTDAQKQEFEGILRGMSDQNLRMYRDMVKFHKSNDYQDPKAGWYSPSRHRVEMDLNDRHWESEVGRKELAAWKTKFHEELHQLDHILGRTSLKKSDGRMTTAKGSWFSPETQEGKRLASAIQQDIVDFVNHAIDLKNKKTKSKIAHVKDLKQIDPDQRKAVFEELKRRTNVGDEKTAESKRNKALISSFTDAMGLASEGELNAFGAGQRYWGHDLKYQRDRGINGATSELWAEIGSHLMREDEESLDATSVYMPQTVKEYKRVLREQAEYIRNTKIGY